MTEMPETAEFVHPISSNGADEWLGGEAFPGPAMHGARRTGPDRPWSPREVFVVALAALTLGTAMGVLFSRPSR
ncbi:MAG: hypothetical protein U0172_07660 [Nitrospiraceae bacterium]